jgi:hypothetical protein
VTLDGLGDLGALKPEDVVKETQKRSIAWFTHTLTLLATISTTKDKLSFERATLKEMQAAFAPAAPSLVVVKVPAFDSPDVAKATPAKLASFAGMKHAKASGGTPTSSAKTAGGEAVAEVKADSTTGGAEKKLEGAAAATADKRLEGKKTDSKKTEADATANPKKAGAKPQGKSDEKKK